HAPLQPSRLRLAPRLHVRQRRAPLHVLLRHAPLRHAPLQRVPPLPAPLRHVLLLRAQRPRALLLPGPPPLCPPPPFALPRLARLPHRLLALPDEPRAVVESLSRRSASALPQARLRPGASTRWVCRSRTSGCGWARSNDLFDRRRPRRTRP